MCSGWGSPLGGVLHVGWGSHSLEEHLLVTPLPALLLSLTKRPRRTPSAAIVTGLSRTPTTPSAAIVAVPDTATIVVPAGRGRDHPRPRLPSSSSQTPTTPSASIVAVPDADHAIVAVQALGHHRCPGRTRP
ncbi:hypothetical protein Taro_013690 [Colocasia esculenta]|uniref:Uncharacterized protein n=1 Tax=Colocasia esculenta TaxID=4460 RepID=A0A843UGW5_COLES|nr:hypothetical protein [Colocasia esculenta]